MSPQRRVGGRLAQCRGTRMTQAQAADRIGVARATLASWESGRCMPRVPDLVVVADCYGVTLDWLIAGRGPMYAQIGTR